MEWLFGVNNTVLGHFELESVHELSEWEGPSTLLKSLLVEVIAGFESDSLSTNSVVIVIVFLFDSVLGSGIGMMLLWRKL